ncbi:hypothetical protein [Actinacidiphila acididurans]|uniref:Uncharacterized protein n=1 Tax=Actinacidiphila acididurans TaxID=2784346 RepID=A0ABS2U462_9ACTN|nr:hypothetical protein [Actinacidiphila acididurans]MBM9510400.1 hypothetical protein [Actinacidiphila acididurans]
MTTGRRPLLHHEWLADVWKQGDGTLLASISVDPAVRAPRMNGHGDAEVLLDFGEVEPGPDLDRRLTVVVARIRHALAALPEIVAYAVAHGPRRWRDHYERADPQPLADRLFLEGFGVDAELNLSVWFDFGDLDMIVVALDAYGRGQAVELRP